MYFRYSLPSTLKSKNSPTRTRSSLPCKLESKKIQIATEETPMVLWHRELKIDPCYIPSKLSLNYTMRKEDDLLADLELFDRLTVSPYNSGEWELILSGHQRQSVERERVFASIHSGLPQHLRSKIWLYLANVESAKMNANAQGVAYQDLVKQPCAVEEDIIKDVVRSFGNLSFFQQNRKQRLLNLQNILMAYANFDKEVGYTQGLNFVAGNLFYFICSKKNNFADKIEECEEEAFWMLVYIMQDQQWRGLYTRDTPRLIELITELETELQSKLPLVYNHLKNSECIAACFSQFFMTLMLYNTPEEFAMRVLEFFLIAGRQAIMQIIIKLLTIAEDDILRKDRIEELWPFIKSEMTANTTNKYQKVFSRFLNHQPTQLPMCIIL